MTLDEAIEELERTKTPYPKYPDALDDMARKSKADQLGIEALERLKDLRGRAMAMHSDHISKLLPGETEK